MHLKYQIFLKHKGEMKLYLINNKREKNMLVSTLSDRVKMTFFRVYPSDRITLSILSCMFLKNGFQVYLNGLARYCNANGRKMNFPSNFHVYILFGVPRVIKFLVLFLTEVS